LELRGRAQGANALAQEIAGGSLRPDAFIAITAEPMQIVLRAGKAAAATPIAHTSMVLAYAPRGRFAPQFARAQEPGAPPWWRILQQPGLRFGRTDPRTDPQGRNIIYVCELAERLYRQPGLAARILGPTLNPAQIFAETMLEARLQSGELDAASAYSVQPGAFGLPVVTLPPEINLGGPLPPLAATGRHPERQRASLAGNRSAPTERPTGATQAKSGEPLGASLELTLEGRVYRPQPLIYYAAALRAAPHPSAAQRFLRWLQGAEAQALLRRHGYDAPGAAPPLTA
ncbi:MAG: substrate-binding domain-containing protein, partial [Terriglobales bacterium]